MAPPKVPNAKIPNAKVRIEDVITKDGKFDSDKFWKLTDVQIANLVGDAIADIRNYIMKPNGEAASSVRLLEALDKENPDLGLGRYVTLFRSIESGNGSALTKSYFDDLKQYDPDTFNLYLKHPGWEAYDKPDFDFEVYRAENMPKDAEPNAGVFTGNPVDTASPTETSSGALTNPLPKLPEASNQSALPNIGKTIKEAEANAYTGNHTGNEPPIADYNTPITPPGVHVSFNEKPVNLSSEEVTKFKPNSASPSPEAIHEAMADAVAKDKGMPKDDTVIVPPEAAAEEAAKRTADTKAVTESTEAKAAEKTEDKATPEKGALTGEPKRFLSKIGGHFKRNLGKYLLGTVGIGIINDLASDNSKIKTLFTGSDVIVESNNPSGNQSRVNSLDQREGAYMPERLLRFRQDTQDPFISNTNVNVDADYEPINEDTPVQQVVNAPAPVNNATADYVRAAYNSYIPSDAGRAYQKAIYGDPLELDRMRLQQQQQKWRDFVMRSGQSPAELVQRGLMPYDALQYV